MNTVDTLTHAAVQMDGHVATLTISGAGSLNILSTPVMKDLVQALELLATRDDLRVVVLRGTGDKGFIGGADIGEMARLTQESGEIFISLLRKFCDGLRHMPVPVIARLPGWCLGGGLEVALACDIRIASEDGRFGMPEVKVGIPSVIHAALLPRLIGNSRANWMLLSGEIVTAREALDWGLVNRLVPPQDLDQEVRRVAAVLAECGTAVMRQQKRLLREWDDQPLDTSIERSVREFGAAFNTGEPQRYMNDFLERKRAAK
ncbi:enoyl-CoA hydratase [Lacisediminimonas profundi]|uniref:enoyl-CoA hydratase n=1 Tax=Lacisediminimonas profundi TaxID=2603856 RepID=UPI00124B0CC2|nr:enoyl-CoA hydratase [Lacisediminimonas profundi]